MMPPHSKSSFKKIQGQSSSSKTPRKAKKNKNKQSSISQNSISHHRRSRRRYSRNKRGRGENDFSCPICLVEFYRPPPPAEEERVVDDAQENEEIFIDAQEPDYYVIIKLIGKLKRNADGTTETMCNHLIHDCCWTQNVNITGSRTCPVCRAVVERIEYYKGPVRYPDGTSRDQEYLTTGRPHRQPICGSRAVVDVLRDNTRVLRDNTRVRAYIEPDEQPTFHLPPPDWPRYMSHLSPDNFRSRPF